MEPTNIRFSDEEAHAGAGLPSPATNQQDRVRLTITTLAGHRTSGPDDDPSANEGRGTPRDTTEGLDQDTCWSDHPDPYHTTLGGLLASNSEPKGDIDVLEKSSSPDSVGEGAMPAEKPSAGLPASSGAALLRRKSHQTRKGLA